MTATVWELQWIPSVEGFNIPLQLPSKLHCDSQATLHISQNFIFHEWTKHLEIDCYMVRDKYKEGFVQPVHIFTKNQVADIFTKILAPTMFSHLFSKLGLVQITTTPTWEGCRNMCSKESKTCMHTRVHIGVSTGRVGSGWGKISTRPDHTLAGRVRSGLFFFFEVEPDSTHPGWVGPGRVGGLLLF